jgi:hypothetical protein
LTLFSAGTCGGSQGILGSIVSTVLDFGRLRLKGLGVFNPTVLDYGRREWRVWNFTVLDSRSRRGRFGLAQFQRLIINPK